MSWHTISDDESMSWHTISDDETCAELGITVPQWVAQDILAVDVRDIVCHGCESGVYMPAVTYRTALDTMSQHGPSVIDYLAAATGCELPELVQVFGRHATSWEGLACDLLSAAVEIWAAGTLQELYDIDDQREGDHT